MTNGTVLPKPPAAVNQVVKETAVAKVGIDDTLWSLNLMCSLEL